MKINAKYKFNLRGWFHESIRHSLAAKRVKTARKKPRHYHFKFKEAFGKEEYKYELGKSLKELRKQPIPSWVQGKPKSFAEIKKMAEENRKEGGGFKDED